MGPARELAQSLQQTEIQLTQAVDATEARLARLHGVLRYNDFQAELGDVATWLGQQQKTLRNLTHQLEQAKDEEADDVVLDKSNELQRALSVYTGVVQHLGATALQLHTGLDPPQGSASSSRMTRTAVAQEQHKALADRFDGLQCSVASLISAAEDNKGAHAVLWDMEALQVNIRAKGQLLDLKTGRDVLAAQVKLVEADVPGYHQAVEQLVAVAQTLAAAQPTHRHALTVRSGMLPPAIEGLQARLATSQALLRELAALKQVEDQRGELEARLDAMHRELQRHTDALHACSEELETPRAAALHRRATEAVREARVEMFQLTQARQEVHHAGTRLAQSTTALPRAMVQQLLTSLEGKQRWKMVSEALTQTDRDVQRVERLMTTARDIERVRES